MARKPTKDVDENRRWFAAAMVVVVVGIPYFYSAVLDLKFNIVHSYNTWIIFEYITRHFTYERIIPTEL